MKSLDIIKNLFNPIIPWDIRPTDCFGRDIAIGDKVAFTLTNYQDRFKKMCKGTIVGFTECFVKIKPDEEYANDRHFKRWINKEWVLADYVLRIPRRVILL